MNNKRGQLLVEFIVVTMGLASFLAAFVMLSELAVLKDRALEAASMGARLQAEGVEDPNVLNVLLTHVLPAKLFSGSVVWTLTHGRYLDSPSSRFYNLRQTRVQGVVTLSVPATVGPHSFSINEKVVMLERQKDAP